MSNPSDVPPQQPGAHPPPEGARPAGHQTPPPGYRAPFGSRFPMPADRPRSFSDALPVGGLSGMFKVTVMPTQLKVSYWIWIIGGLLGLLDGVIRFFGSFVLIAFAPPLGLVVLVLALSALALATAQIVLAMKMKEGPEWARLGLTIVAGISLLLALVNAGVAQGRGGGSVSGFLISLVAAVLMWLPKPQAWFAARRGRI